MAKLRAKLDSWMAQAGATAASAQRSGPPPGAPNVMESWPTDGEWAAAWGSPSNVIAGESHRQKELKAAAGKRGRCLVPVNVTLQPEPENEYDSDAIKALVGGRHVGYLRAELAAVAAPKMRQWDGPQRIWVIAGVIRGGGENRDLGVHVWLNRRVVPCPALGMNTASWHVSWPPSEAELESAGLA